MKLLPLLLAFSFCLTSPSWAQSEGGDLKSESESQQSPAGADDSMNSMWADNPEVKGETKKTSSKSKSKSKSKNKESKFAPVTAGTSEVKSESQPIQLEPTVKAESDPQNTTVEKETSLSTPIPLETNIPAGGETTIIDVGGLCLSSVFQNSDLVRNSAWPGVGPFTGQNNQYTDAQDNKLKMQVDGDHVTALELLLNNQNGSKQSFLNLEMTCDFILEALGTKGSKIAEFNSYFEKNKDRISSSKVNGENQVKTSAGAYVLGLANTGSNTMLIQISSKNGRVNAEQSLASSTQSVTPAEEPTEVVATLPVAKPVKPATVAPKIVKPVKVETKAEVKPEIKSEIKPDKVEKTDQKDPLKDELAGAIRTWQTVKKSALKDRNPAGLSKILSGNLLQRQTDSIKALTESKHFYELTPKGVVVEKYTELSSSPAKYSVYAKVMELTKIMKDGATKPEKETDDTYSVNYTVERSGDHWTISNSLLLVKKK